MKLKAWVVIFCLIVGAVSIIALEQRFGFSLTGLILVLFALLILAVLTIKLSLNVRWLRKGILKSFSGDRAAISCELGSGPLATAAIFTLGCVLGLAVYADRTNAFYRNLSDAYCRADVLTDVFSAENGGNWPPLKAEFRSASTPCSTPKAPSAGRLDLKQLYKVLRHYNLLDPDDPTDEALASAGLQAKTSGKVDSTNRNAKIAAIVASDSFKFNAGEPTVDLVLALAAGLKGTTKHPCVDQSDILQRTALASALAQQPFPAVVIDPKQLRELNGKADFAIFGREPIGREMQRLREASIVVDGESSKEASNKDNCAAYLEIKGAGIGNRLSLWSSFTFERPGPELTSQELTSLALTWHVPVSNSPPANNTLAEAQEDAVLRFMAVLLSEMRGTEVVRGDRRLVNALIGYERCIVIMLAFVFAIFLFVRFVQRLPHEIHRSEIESEMARFRERWFMDADGRQAALKRAEDAKELRNRLVNGYFADEPVKKIAKRQVTTIPLRILGAALDEMQLSNGASNPGAKVESTFVETVSDGERRSLDGSRLIFDTLLPTFPAIGFVGTVSSLLIAMSEADRIVKTDEALARGIAAAQVTDILSLCFSTTLLALLCVLIFSPLALMQASRERRLIDDTEYQVQTILRPEQP